MHDIVSTATITTVMSRQKTLRGAIVLGESHITRVYKFFFRQSIPTTGFVYSNTLTPAHIDYFVTFEFEDQ